MADAVSMFHVSKFLLGRNASIQFEWQADLLAFSIRFPYIESRQSFRIP